MSEEYFASWFLVWMCQHMVFAVALQLAPSVLFVFCKSMLYYIVP